MKLFAIIKIGSNIRAIHQATTLNREVVDGPFKSYDAAAKQADLMNKNAASPRFIAVVQS